MDDPSEVIVKATMCEPYILEDLSLREVSICKLGLSKRLFIKIDGTNNKSDSREQIQLYLDQSDAEQLCLGINECVKTGLFEEEKL